MGRQYAGRGIGELRRARGRDTVDLPNQDEATLLPKPLEAQQQIYDLFVAVNGNLSGSHPGRPRPPLTGRDVKLISNFVTCALRNDLPHANVYDAAVIWEKWRQTVTRFRDLLKEFPEDHQALNVQYVLDYHWTDVCDCLSLSMSDPGMVADRYCPWKADFFTQERLYPESV